MNLQRDTRDHDVESRSETSHTSVYSTCSNGHNSNSSGSNFQDTVQSAVLAGQNTTNARKFNATMGESFLNNDFSISPFNQNLDILMDESDDFMDCIEENESDSNKNDSKSSSLEDQSTEYIPVGKLAKCHANNHYLDQDKSEGDVDKNNLANGFSAGKETNPDRLVTIVEEHEVSRKSFDNTAKYLSEFVSEIKNSNISTKRVLFVNENNDTLDDEKSKKNPKYIQKTPKLLAGNKQFSFGLGKGINKHCNTQNTTESFVMWEKYCEATENFSLRKSFSFSELNTSSDYGADNEFSATLKSLDDTYVSKYTVELSKEDCSLKTKPIYRSKSCESLLREVKHLPHVLYDKFLKCLSTEIENMRKQRVYCSCQRTSRKSPNKRNFEKYINNNMRNPTYKIGNIGKMNKKENKLSSKVSLLNPTINKNRSPDMVKKLSNEKVTSSPIAILKESSYLRPNVQRPSPKSPNKSVTSPMKKQKLCWQKEVISPVGEYIRGKRPSPYKSSPVKRVM